MPIGVNNATGRTLSFVWLDGSPFDFGSTTGTGIPDDSLRRIFSAYAQDDPGQQHRRSPSTGLGLAICRRLARLLKGKIQVTSRVGEGSCFTLWLPLELVAEATPASE